jgi:hypothetical protein
VRATELQAAKGLPPVSGVRRAASSRRSVEHCLPDAIADVVGNSIDAAATRVAIRLEYEGADSWVRITDDGIGFTARRLNDIIRRHADQRGAGVRSAGFAFGVRAASLRHCGRLTIATRTSPLRREIDIRRWEVDSSSEESRYQPQHIRAAEVRSEALRPLRDHAGTVVLWERLNSVLSYRNPTGIAAERGFHVSRRLIERHLAMVFHRFLTGEAHRPIPLLMTLDRRPLEGWDPFARAERWTRCLPAQVLSESHGHGVTVRPFLLPLRELFSDQQAWETTGGPQGWRRQQGFYVYRCERLVQAGGWNYLRSPSPLMDVVRIAVDIPPQGDTGFERRIGDSRIVIPTSLRAGLRSLISEVATEAVLVNDRASSGRL